MLSPEQIDSLCAGSASRVQQLRDSLRACGSALVAFSGGVDSAFVLKIALDELGERAVALTALSASVAPDEAEEAKALAAQLGARHVVVASNELADPRYAANPANRCYFCKTELYTISEKVRAEQDLAVVLDGFNADDKKDHRPGHQAAREHDVDLLLQCRQSGVQGHALAGKLIDARLIRGELVAKQTRPLLKQPLLGGNDISRSILIHAFRHRNVKYESRLLIAFCRQARELRLGAVKLLAKLYEA